MEIFKSIFIGIAILILGFYFIGSPFIFIVSMLRKKDLDQYPFLGIKFLNRIFFFSTTFLVLPVLLSFGFEKLLFLIPSESGVRSSISLLLGFTLGSLICVDWMKREDNKESDSHQ